ncbi:MAG: hypothetical protein QOG72_2455 [Sphingomonadales bacterium]|jgi:hypothetical protein|nr:hypothetical protein [Sphingomonadales bacterium]
MRRVNYLYAQLPLGGAIVAFRESAERLLGSAVHIELRPLPGTDLWAHLARRVSREAQSSSGSGGL